MTSKKLAKPIKTKYVRFVETWQPQSAGEYAWWHINNVAGGSSWKLLITRLLVVLVGRGLLNAAEFRYIVSGKFIPESQWEDWTPADEIDEGLEIPVLGQK